MAEKFSWLTLYALFSPRSVLVGLIAAAITGCGETSLVSVEYEVAGVVVNSETLAPLSNAGILISLVKDNHFLTAATPILSTTDDTGILHAIVVQTTMIERGALGFGGRWEFNWMEHAPDHAEVLVAEPEDCGGAIIPLSRDESVFNNGNRLTLRLGTVPIPLVSRDEVQCCGLPFIRSADDWYDPAPRTEDPNDAPINAWDQVPHDRVFEVASGLLLEAEWLLRDTPLVPLDFLEARRFTEASLLAFHLRLTPFLVRGLITTRNGSFDIRVDEGSLLVDYASLGCTTYLSRQPLVVSLTEKPSRVYVVATTIL